MTQKFLNRLTGYRQVGLPWEEDYKASASVEVFQFLIYLFAVQSF